MSDFRNTKYGERGLHLDQRYLDPVQRAHGYHLTTLAQKPGIGPPKWGQKCHICKVHVNAGRKKVTLSNGFSYWACPACYEAKL